MAAPEPPESSTEMESASPSSGGAQSSDPLQAVPSEEDTNCGVNEESTDSKAATQEEQEDNVAEDNNDEENAIKEYVESAGDDEEASAEPGANENTLVPDNEMSNQEEEEEELIDDAGGEKNEVDAEDEDVDDDNDGVVNEVTCSKCSNKFTDLQTYMEHSCIMMTCEASLAEDDDDERMIPMSANESELSDMENFEGEIVYQEDGSAYLIDGSEKAEKEGSAEVPKETAKAEVSKLFKEHGGMNVLPGIVNALHIPGYMTMGNVSQFGPGMIGPYGTPIVHSFKVYDVRNKAEKEEEDAAEKDSIAASVGKPILMCFLCKLSFGFAKSFLTHATHEHKMTLNEKEKGIMARKEQSAIIQGLGKEKEPLLSFLSPKDIKQQASSHSIANLRPTPGGFGQSVYSSANSYMYPVSVTISTTPHTTTTVSTTSDAASTHLDTNSLGGLHFNSTAARLDRQDSNRSAEGAERSQEGQSHRPQSRDSERQSRYSEILSAGGYQVEDDGYNRHLGLSQSPSQNRMFENHLENKEANNHGSEYPSNNNNKEADLEAAHMSSMHDENSMDDIPHNHDPSDPSGSVECPKCDMVLGSSRSLGGHMTMMHSRNSCKTLKCPKCNWHYKYQQTLEAHMKEKHPESESKCIYCETNQPHPRLSRGESYTCGYKPYRCEICNYSTTTKGNLSIHMQSDKHLNNMQELQNGSDHIFMHHKMNDLAQVAKPKNKQTWRCDVCDYETNVARNLRIHMTSEKHIHNMMAIQQNVSQMQREMQNNVTGIPTEESMYMMLAQNQMVPVAAHGQDPNMVDMQAYMSQYQYDPVAYNAWMNNMAMGMNVQEAAAAAPHSNTPDDPNKNEPLSLYQCSICNNFNSEDLDDLHIHVHRDRSEPNMALWRAVIGDMQQCMLCNYSTQVKANFQLHLKTDKHQQKLQLFNHIREGGKQNEWRLKYMNVGNPIQVRCNACDFYTHNVDKLRAHSHHNNYRHETSLKLFRHMQSINITMNAETRRFHCPLCSFYTRTKFNLMQHIQSVQHLKNEAKLAKKDGQSAEPEASTAEGVLDLSKKERSPSTGSLSEDQLLNSSILNNNEPKPENLSKPNTSSNFSSKSESRGHTTTQIYSCPYCKYSCVDQQRITAHVMSQHSVKPASVLRCPLCQEVCTNRINMEVHLMDSHSVSRDCIQRLLMSVDNSENGSPHHGTPPTSNAVATATHPKETTSRSESRASSSQDPEAAEVGPQPQSSPQSSPPIWETDSLDLYRCQNCHKNFANIDQLYSHQNESCPLKEQDTPNGPGFLCWKKGCNQYFKTASGLQVHFKEIHVKRHLLPVARMELSKPELGAGQVSLKCVVCQKVFRSMSSLQIHLETTHPDLNQADVMQMIMSMPNGDIAGLLQNGPNEMPDDDDQQDMSDSFLGCNGNEDSLDGDMDDMEMDGPKPEEGSFLDPTKKFKCQRCRVGFSKQSELSSHNKTVFHRKGDHAPPQTFSGDKYMDPNRPYKCDVCRESFTQKSILLVHYNSVSHLHKLKLSLNEPVEPEVASEPGDNKPFKCSLCKVAYSQQSTLDTHIRSVLHQSRAAKQDSSSAPTTEKEDGEQMLLGVGGTILPVPSPSQQQQHQHQKQKPEQQKQHQPKPSKSPATSEVQHQQEQLIQAQQQAQLQAQHAYYQQIQFQQALQLQQLHQAQLQQQIAAQLSGVPGQATDPNVAALLSQDLSMMLMQGYNPSAAAMMYPAQIPLSPSMYSCVLCGSVLPSQEALVQHQQTCPKAAATNVGTSATPSVSTEKSTASTTVTPATTTVTTSVVSKPTEAPNARRIRTSAVQRKLLESYGFDLVQQFTESAMGLPSSIAPEDKFFCQGCKKEFSSIWVYKAHMEEIHKKLLPNEVIEKYTQLFKDELKDEEEEEEIDEQETDQQEDKSQAGKIEKKIKSEVEDPKEPLVNGHAASPSDPSGEEQSASQVMPPPPPPPPPQVYPVNPYQLAMLQAIQPGTTSSTSTTGVQAYSVPVHGVQHMHNIAQQQSLSPAGMQQLPAYLDANYLQQKSPKRARTRITDDQLKILRAYFDINNSPTEEAIAEMSAKSCLPHKVIKHWFRNTLFKERQRNKDSPYNFNNPPTTSLLDVDRAKKRESTDLSTGGSVEKKAARELERDHLDIDPMRVTTSPSMRYLAEQAMVKPCKQEVPLPPPQTPPPGAAAAAAAATAAAQALAVPPATAMKDPTPQSPVVSVVPEPSLPRSETSEMETAAEERKDRLREINDEYNDRNLEMNLDERRERLRDSLSREYDESKYSVITDEMLVEKHLKLQMPSGPPLTVTSAPNTPTSSISDMTSPLSSPISPMAPRSVISPTNHSGGSGSSADAKAMRRSGRTRFTDYQIKVLQEFFESNAYPKDDDLDHLSRMLNLSPRVIVVWFQNARQKARKMFENQAPPEGPPEQDGLSGRYKRTPGLNYQCNKCMLVFQRFYELIKHQKQHCYKYSSLSSTSSGSSQHSPTSAPSQISPDPFTKLSSEATTPKHMAESPHSSSRSRSSERKPSPTPPAKPSPAEGEKPSKSGHHYKCEQCKVAFPQLEQWREHQQVHLMGMQIMNQYMPQQVPYNMMYMPYDAALNGLTTEQYMSYLNSSSGAGSPTKSKHSDTSDEAAGQSSDQSSSESDPKKDKRLRTTISPAQLDILYAKYQEDSNPTRKMLDLISDEVGLKKRVVQVWFQNTRARERKGLFRLSALQPSMRCPFCKAAFKVKSALEAHIKVRHFDKIQNSAQVDTIIAQACSPDTLHAMEMEAGRSSVGSEDRHLDSRASDPYLYSDDSRQLAYSEDGDRGRDEEELHRSRRYKEERNDDERHEYRSWEEQNEIEMPLRTSSHKGSESRGALMQSDIVLDKLPKDSFLLSPTSSLAGDDAISEAGSMDRSEDSYSNADDAEKRRYRTQMSVLQLKILKHCFNDYRTPTIHECELLGQEIGLPRRVVQVWFQNARAKDKKGKGTVSKHFGMIAGTGDGNSECKICKTKYSSSMSVRDHVFTEMHVRNVRLRVAKELEKYETEESNLYVPKLEQGRSGQSPAASTSSSSHHHPAGTPPSSSMAQSLGLSPAAAAQMQALQAMQAQMMNPQLPAAHFQQVASAAMSSAAPGSSSKSDKDNSSSRPPSTKSIKTEAEGSSGQPSSSQANVPTSSAAAAAAAISAAQMGVNPNDAALMSYMYGGLPPYYAQMPMMYPVYPTMGLEMLYAQEQAAATASIPPHILQAYASNPLAAAQLHGLMGKSAEEVQQLQQQQLQQEQQQQQQSSKSSSSHGGSHHHHHHHKSKHSEKKEKDYILQPNSSTNRYLCRKCERVFTDVDLVTSHQVTKCYLGKVVNVEETVERLPANRYLCQLCPRDALFTDEDIKRHIKTPLHQQKLVRKLEKKERRHNKHHHRDKS